MSSAPDPLDSLLDQWRQARPPMPTHESLTQQVWCRIADADAETIETGLGNRVERTFRTPSFAFAFVAACTLFGLFLAEVRVSRQQAQRNVQLAQAYLQLIDPLVSDSVANNGNAAGKTRNLP